MNRANQLTLLRVLFIPVYLVLWRLNFPWHNIVALAVFILASLTDLLDGQIARRKGLVTDFGKFMDPLADKVLVLSAMISFCAMGRMPDWAVVIVICREFAVSGLRLVALQSQVLDAYNESRLGSVMEVLCEGFDPGMGGYVGRTYADSVEVDGRVWFTAAGVVPAGEFVQVRITGVEDGDLIGEME